MKRMENYDHWAQKNNLIFDKFYALCFGIKSIDTIFFSKFYFQVTHQNQVVVENVSNICYGYTINTISFLISSFELTDVSEFIQHMLDVFSPYTSRNIRGNFT